MILSNYMTSRSVKVSLVMLLSLQAGCVALPMPALSTVGPTHQDAVNFSRDIDETSAALFENGRSTRKDVLLTLGEPDFVHPGERTFVYEAEVTPGGSYVGVLLITPFGPGMGNTPLFEYKKYRLTINFDANGFVESSEFERFDRPEEN